LKSSDIIQAVCPERFDTTSPDWTEEREIVLLSPAAARRVERGENARARTGRMRPGRSVN
jgi:hypothetical protein